MTHPKQTVRSSVFTACGAALAVVALVGCAAAESTPAARTGGTTVQAPQAATGDQDVLAIVNGKEVTLADLEDFVGPRLGQMDYEYRSQRHQVIESAMRNYVRDQLIEATAEEQGVTPQAFLEELFRNAAPVSDEDIRFFYLQNQAQLQGRPFEAIAPQIRGYLENQQRETLLLEFSEEAESEYSVDYLLEPFRVDIDITGAPSWGPEDAALTIVEFSDFECPYCNRFNPTLEQVKEEYAGKVRLVFLQFPLRDIHPAAQKAAEASLCANDQGKFWEIHDLMFAEQDSLGVADLKEKAERLGLDTEVFNACLDSGTYAARVDEDMAKGVPLGVSGTPAVFINGRPLVGGAVPFEMAAELIDDELARIGR